VGYLLWNVHSALSCFDGEPLLIFLSKCRRFHAV